MRARVGEGPPLNAPTETHISQLGQENEPRRVGASAGRVMKSFHPSTMER